MELQARLAERFTAKHWLSSQDQRENMDFLSEAAIQGLYQRSGYVYVRGRFYPLTENVYALRNGWPDLRFLPDAQTYFKLGD